MNQFENFSIGFGNDQGQTTLTLLQEKKSKIQLFNLKTVQIEHPKIQVRKFNPINLGQLQDCIRKTKDRSVLSDLLKIQLNCDTNKILQNCSNMKNRMANDLLLLGAMMEENKKQQKQQQIINFKNKTKATDQQAKKYIAKYQNCDEAVKNYTKHQEIIKKFMQQYQCDRQNAINFLQSNDYQML